jgi:hypothetical protein
VRATVARQAIVVRERVPGVHAQGGAVLRLFEFGERASLSVDLEAETFAKDCFARSMSSTPSETTTCNPISISLSVTARQLHPV